MVQIVLYQPRRKACNNRVKALPTIGITSHVGEGYGNRHFLFFDIDKKNLDIVMQIVDTCMKDPRSRGFIVNETRKGYHVIIIGEFPWKVVNHYWSKFKNYLDRKWITLQRKRKYAILRVGGKYNRDIKTIMFCVPEPWVNHTAVKLLVKH